MRFHFLLKGKGLLMFGVEPVCKLFDFSKFPVQLIGHFLVEICVFIVN